MTGKLILLAVLATSTCDRPTDPPPVEIQPSSQAPVSSQTPDSPGVGIGTNGKVYFGSGVGISPDGSIGIEVSPGFFVGF